jgi:methionine synthase II (cobalamin-independent)
MSRPFQPGFLPTAVGSLPHSDPIAACDLVRKFLPEIPAWPQLPKRDPRESIYAQLSRNFPGATIQDGRVVVDRSRDLTAELERLYARYLENDYSAFAMSADEAAGLSRFMTLDWHSACAVKGQLMGPISWGLTVTDQARRSILYDDGLADAVAKHMHMHAVWQENELRKLSPQTIVFIDEPYLASFGSAYVAVERDQVIALLEEAFAGLRGLKGIHCCGNTDWSLLLSTSLDILNFDAFNFAETLSLYPGALRAFLDRGGIIAWGIVPVANDAAVMSATADDLVLRLGEAMKLIASKGVPLDAMLEASLITPACGMGTLSEVAAERALQLASQVSKKINEKHAITIIHQGVQDDSTNH